MGKVITSLSWLKIRKNVGKKNVIKPIYTHSNYLPLHIVQLKKTGNLNLNNALRLIHSMHSALKQYHLKKKIFALT